MQRSIFLAKLIGPTLLVIGLGMLFNGNVYRAMADEFLRSHALIYLSGLLTLLAGLALVNAHHVWSDDWRLIITILGWLGVIGGTLRILVPQQIEAIGSGLFVHPAILIFGGLVVILFGGTLSYFGYFAPPRAATTSSTASRAASTPARKTSPSTRAKAGRSKRK